LVDHAPDFREAEHGSWSLEQKFQVLARKSFSATYSPDDIFYQTLLLLLQCLDSTSVPEEIRNEKKGDLKNIIGVPMNFINRKGINAEVLANFNDAIERLKGAGYTIKDISIEHLEKSLSVYYIVMFAEVSSNLARYDGIRYGLSNPGETSIQSYFESRTAGFGAEVRRRILIGTYVLSSGYYDAYYNKANLVREMLRKEFEEVFKEVDVKLLADTEDLLKGAELRGLAHGFKT
jgi:aspartyl-tRNA(Asn)/glutamyl-tRNA(Gln) amidotransferase subunit A